LPEVASSISKEADGIPVNSSKLTVYFDGACPLCRAEMSYYKSKDVAGAIIFSDVADISQAIPQDLNRQQAMSRLHVRTQTGDVVSGAAAFVKIWQSLPGWSWAARIATLPGMTPILELAYRLFLPVRPVFSTLFGALQTTRS